MCTCALGMLPAFQVVADSFCLAGVEDPEDGPMSQVKRDELSVIVGVQQPFRAILRDQSEARTRRLGSSPFFRTTCTVGKPPIYPKPSWFRGGYELHWFLKRIDFLIESCSANSHFFQGLCMFMLPYVTIIGLVHGFDISLQDWSILQTVNYRETSSIHGPVHAAGSNNHY